MPEQDNYDDEVNFFELLVSFNNLRKKYCI